MKITEIMINDVARAIAEKMFKEKVREIAANFRVQRRRCPQRLGTRPVFIEGCPFGMGVSKLSLILVEMDRLDQIFPFISSLLAGSLIFGGGCLHLEGLLVGSRILLYMEFYLLRELLHVGVLAPGRHVGGGPLHRGPPSAELFPRAFARDTLGFSYWA
ncbi:UNVERIFIED_CONTAM: hypothetical protein Sradi_4325900 [Sesamum radiatum]|uniref:Uncharacterized protein n=1 Tax=Sesamum radiatum TaxID=300843 RepID=A0AAW2NR21_SESRA